MLSGATQTLHLFSLFQGYVPGFVFCILTSSQHQVRQIWWGIERLLRLAVDVPYAFVRKSFMSGTAVFQSQIWP